MNNYTCPNSYSGEHTGEPVNENEWKCTHCGKIMWRMDK